MKQSLYFGLKCRLGVVRRQVAISNPIHPARRSPWLSESKTRDGANKVSFSLFLSRISTDVGEPWATRGRRCGHTGGLWRLSTGPCERLRFFSWKNGFSVSLNSVAGAPRTIVMSYYSADDGPQRTSTTRTRPRRTPENRENATEERGGEGG